MVRTSKTTRKYMKSNELRIGNYVKAEGEEVFRLNYDVMWAIMERRHQDTDKDSTDYNFETDIEPIPLTEEWLIKFGFIMREESYHKFPTIRDTYDRTKIVERLDRVYSIYDEQADDWRKLSVLVILDPSTLKIRSIGVNGVRNKFIVPADIRSVHQLQNLFFALTGEELQIKDV